jgi:molybdopterin converting factor small subunit
MKKIAKKDVVDTITVKISRTGGQVTEYSLEGDDPTVGDALEAARIEISKGDRIRVNGELVDEDTVVSQDDIITITGKVSGGR